MGLFPYTKLITCQIFLLFRNSNSLPTEFFYSLSGKFWNQIYRETWDSFTLRGSSVTCKHMEPSIITTYIIYFLAGVNQTDVPTLCVNDYPLYFLHSKFTWCLTPIICRINRIIIRKNSEKHNFTALLCGWSLVEMLSKMGCKYVWFLSCCNFLATSWKCCSVLFWGVFWVFPK